MLITREDLCDADKRRTDARIDELAALVTVTRLNDAFRRRSLPASSAQATEPTEQAVPNRAPKETVAVTA